MKEDHIAGQAESLRKLIEDFDPDVDLGTVMNTQAIIDAREEQRTKEIRAGKERNRALAKALNAAQQAATRPASVPSAAQRTADMNALDKERMGLIKAVRTGEAALSKAQDQGRRLKEEVQRLESTDIADEHVVDSSILQLELFKQLGFEPMKDKTGTITKMLVRSHSGEVHVVDVLDGGLSGPALTAKLWELVSS